MKKKLTIFVALLVAVLTLCLSACNLGGLMGGSTTEAPTITATLASSISLNQTAVTLQIGDTVTLTATVLPADADQTVTYTSTNTAVATVTNGVVSANAEGTAVILVTTANGKIATCTVTVEDGNASEPAPEEPGNTEPEPEEPADTEIAVTSLSLSASQMKLSVGGSSTLYAIVAPTDATNKAVTWTSSNIAVASVNNGRVTGNSDGIAVIVATTANGKVAFCTVTVGAGAGSSDSTTTPSEPTEPILNTISVNKTLANEKFYLKNTFATDNGVAFSAISAATAYKVTGAGDVKATFQTTAVATMEVCVDGNFYQTVVVPAGTNTVTLASGLSAGTHEILLVKTAGASTVTLSALVLAEDGALGAKPSVSTTATTTKCYTNVDKFKITGRSCTREYGICCDYSGAGFEFTVYTPTGTDVTATFRISGSYTTYFTVYVDGVRQNYRLALEALNPNDTAATIATGLAPGFHTIRLVRQSNLWHSYCALNTLTFTGSFGPTPALKDRFIEFIGDSISCGYGVLPGEDAEGYSGGSDYAEATKAHTFLTAERLGADYSICGYSGYGLVAGTVGDRVQDRYLTVHTGRGEKVYNFTRKPDLIVINLGTNDKNVSTDAEYKQVVKDFITLVREKNGADVPIIWAYGAMTTTLSTGIKNAINELGGASAGLYYCAYTTNTAGGDGHPSEAGQAKMADELTAFIRQNIPAFADR